MIIDSIELCNINTLYNLLSEIRHSDHKGIIFGRNMSNLLEHMSITMSISDISLLEAFYLKQYTCGNFILNNTKIDFLSKNSGNIESVTNIIKSIDDDTDVKIKPGYLFFPIGSIKCDCFITLTGNTLCSIFSTFPENFFRMIFPDFNEKVLLSHINNKDLELINNKIIESFYKSFFKFCNEKVNVIDLISDYGIEKEYYKYGDISSATLSTVQTAKGGFNLAARDTDDIGTQINLIKDNLLSLRKKDIKNSTKLIYTCNSSLNTFLKLFFNLDINYFIDFEDIKKVISKDEYVFPNCFNKYKIRLNNNINDLVDYKNKLLENTKGNADFTKYNTLLMNSSISYSLKLSFDDIEKIHRKWLDSEICNCESNTYITQEIYKLISDINKQKEMVKKTFIE